MESVVLHSWKRIGTSPFVVYQELDSLLVTVQERQIMFNHNFTALMLDEILKTSTSGEGHPNRRRSQVQAAPHLSRQEEGNHQR